MKELVKLKDKVEHCLKNLPETRNSDITLTIAIWQNHHSVGSQISLSQLYDLPREDNIKRIRAKFQNEMDLYLPTDWKVAKKRRINEDKWKEFIKKFKSNQQQLAFL